MPGDQVPKTEKTNVEVDKELTIEKVSIVLALMNRRLDFMQRKINRFNELKDDLTPDEMQRLWDESNKFRACRESMDSVLTECLNKDGKI